MIAGPGIEWYRGDGPMPDLDSLEIPVSIRAARVSKRLPANPQSTSTQQNTAATISKGSPANAQSARPARQCRAATWRKPPACRVEPPARHNPETSVKPATRPQKKANKRRTTFPKPAQTCSQKKQSQRTEVRGQNPSVIRGAISQLPHQHQAKNDPLPTQQATPPKAAQPPHKQCQSNTPRRASK